MDETEFLRGIEGEEQNGTDLVSGAEHLVRLKIQAGQQTQPKYDDLEIEKKANRLSGLDIANIVGGTAVPMAAGGLLGAQFGGVPGMVTGGVLGGLHGLRSEANHHQLMKQIEHSQEKKAFFGLGQPNHIKQQNAWADDMNQPGNVDKVNNLMIDYARKNFPHADKVNPLSNLHPSEWEVAYAHAMADPHFRAMHDKHYGTKKEAAHPLWGAAGIGREAIHKARGLEKDACMSCGKAKTACMCSTKTAYEIQPSSRPDIPTGDFAQPHKEEAGHEGKYPIPDRQHARSALGFAKMHHDSGALAAVRHKIEQKYPDMLHDKEKTAAVLKAALLEKLASPGPEWNKSMLAATTGLGALAGGLGTYLASRAQGDTGKSKMEENLGATVEANKGKPERGLLQKLKNRQTENAHGIAQAFREHPAKASLLGALTGAAGGYGLGQLGGAIARRGGK